MIARVDLDHPTYECCGGLYPFKEHETNCALCGDLFDWEELLEYWNLEDYEEYYEEYIDTRFEMCGNSEETLAFDDNDLVWSLDQCSLFGKATYQNKGLETGSDPLLIPLPEDIL